MKQQPLLFDFDEDDSRREPDSEPHADGRRLRQELLRSLTRGLAIEWDLIAGLIPPDLRKGFHPPTFGLRDGDRGWGCWVSAPVREIRISTRLILEHPWYAVVDVLRHEMAHQYAHEVLRANGEPPHGPAFRKACRIVGANPLASGDYPPLDQLAFAPDAKIEDRDRILLKVEKLLALAESPNRHEAERAMEKAHEMMARYNLELRKRPGNRDDYVSICLGEPKGRHTRGDQILATLLGTYYFVRCVWIQSYMPGKDRPGRILEISGTVANVRLAHYVYDFVRNHIRMEWDVYRRTRRNGTAALRDLTVGILLGLREKLEVQVGGSDVSQALIRAGDPGLNDYIEGRYRALRSSRRRTTYHDPETLADGKDIGRKMVIRKGVEEGPAGTGTAGLLR